MDLGWLRRPPVWGVWALGLVVVMGILGFASAQGDGPGAAAPEPQAGRAAGHFTFNGTHVAGTYVSFAYEEETGRITDYRVLGTLFFRTIQAPGAWSLTVDGHMAAMASDGYGLLVFDAPTGPFRLQTDGARFVLNWPIDAGFTYEENYFRIKAADGRQAFLTNAQQNYEGMLVTGPSLFKVQASTLGNAHGVGYAFQDTIDQATARGLLGAHIVVLHDSIQVLALDDVDVAAERRGNESYRVVVDGQVGGGRAFVVDFPPGTMQQDIDVTFYDQALGALVPSDIALGDSVDDVLAAEEGEGAEYWWSVEPAGTRLMVWVPSFSVHAFDVLGIPPEFVPIIVYGLVAGFVFAVIAAAGMFMKPRRA